MLTGVEHQDEQIQFNSLVLVFGERGVSPTRNNCAEPLPETLRLKLAGRPGRLLSYPCSTPD